MHIFISREIPHIRLRNDGAARSLPRGFEISFASSCECDYRRDNRRFNILVDDSDERCRGVFSRVLSSNIFRIFRKNKRAILYPLIKALVETLDCNGVQYVLLIKIIYI